MAGADDKPTLKYGPLLVPHSSTGDNLKSYIDDIPAQSSASDADHGPTTHATRDSLGSYLSSETQSNSYSVPEAQD